MRRKLPRREFLRRALLAAGVLPGLARAEAWRALVAAAPKALRGIFAILATPFNRNDQVDWEDLEREVDFCARAGAQGVVWPQLTAEFYLLTEEERLRGSEVLVRAAAGRLPVVVGVQAPARDLAVKFARYAEEKGADAVIALPPYLGQVSLEAAADYFRALARAVKLPVFVQNSGGSWGPALPTSLVIQLAKENPRLGYVKEEIPPVAHRLAEYVRSGVMTGIFSGNAAVNLLNELPRQTSGSMPACEFVDIDAQVYELATAGKTEEARALFLKLLPMIKMEETYGVGFVKTVLVRRGVFKTARLRSGSGSRLDAVDEQELDAWWKQLAPHFKV